MKTKNSGFKTLEVKKTVEDRVELLSELKADIQKLADTLKLLTDRVAKLETDAAEKVCDLENKLDYMEQRDRTCCLRFYKVPIETKNYFIPFLIIFPVNI